MITMAICSSRTGEEGEARREEGKKGGLKKGWGVHMASVLFLKTQNNSQSIPGVRTNTCLSQAGGGETTPHVLGEGEED